MRLEGTLDAFSLPDIFQLLSYTKKTGTLHLRRDAQHGVVHLRDGAVTGGRGDATCQALGRRMVGAGLVSDQDLADTVDLLIADPATGLGKALADHGSLPTEDAQRLAAEQTKDAVFELLRWENGEFAFVVDESDPDDVGSALVVEEVIDEARKRVEIWNDLITKVPSFDAPVTIATKPQNDPALSHDEWALLSLVDGQRTVADLVRLSGTGEYVVVSALVALADRGLLGLEARPDGDDPLSKRQQLMAKLEGKTEAPVKAVRAMKVVEEPAPDEEEDEIVVPDDVSSLDEVVEPEPEPEPEPVAEVIEEPSPVIPERPEPFTPERKPDYAEEPLPALARLSSAPSTPSASPTMASVGSVQGAHALQPSLEEAPALTPGVSTLIDRDPSVNKSLLLRLIAGVRGL